MKESYNFLVIDDDQDDHEIFISALNIAFPHASCNFVYNRFEAIKDLKSGKNNIPDYIFMDWNMPGMNAEEFMKELKLLPGLEDVNVFVLSGSAPYVELKYLYELGVKKVLMKQSSIPLLSQELVEAIALGAN